VAEGSAPRDAIDDDVSCGFILPATTHTCQPDVPGPTPSRANVRQDRNRQYRVVIFLTDDPANPLGMQHLVVLIKDKHGACSHASQQPSVE
jgi:hypothetical protein